MYIREINTNKELEKRFLNYIKTYQGSFTCCSNLKSWMEHDRKLRAVKSLTGFKQVMSDSKDYSQQECYKVDRAYRHFLEEVILHLAKPDRRQKTDTLFG